MADDQAGGLHCRNCGHEQQMGWDDPESWMEGKFDWDFNLPLEGMAQGDELLEPGERNWVIPTRNFGPRRQGSTRSLYHGTLLDHLPSIQQHGLLPEVGPFASDAYDLDEPSNWMAFSPEEVGVEPVAFMTDKKRLNKALNAIRFNVAQKLNKRFGEVTPLDVRNHGLLLKHKGEMGAQDPPMNYVWDEQHEEPFEEGPRSHPARGVAGEGPFQAEPGDYYSREPVGGLDPIHGPAMMRVFERHGLIPWWDPMKPSEGQMPAAAQEVYGAWRFAMPVTPQYWKQRPKDFALYHGTSPDRMESIMQHGLHPWDSEIAGGTNYGEPTVSWGPLKGGDSRQWLKPRPGHVYLSQDPYDAHSKGLNAEIGGLPPGTNVEEYLNKPIVFKIDPRKLSPQHINPDEDFMLSGGGKVNNQEEYPEYNSLGEMADRMGWGEIPSDTERVIGRGKSIGYRGVIPPEALTPGRYRNGEWTPLERTSAHFGSTMYHVAPAHAERAIAQEGLRGDPEEWDDMVWLHENEDQARSYAQPEDHVYAVNTAGMESDPRHMLEPGMQHSWVAKGPIPPERIKRIATAHLIDEMRDGWGRFASGGVPWEYGKWGKGIYYPDTGTLLSWGDDRTHPEVALEDENAAQGDGHHFVIRPNGTVKDQGAMNSNFESVEGDVPGLAEALHSLDPRLRLDKPSAWDFGPTEPMEEEPSSVSRGEDGGTIHDVQTANDFAGSL